MKNFLPKDSCGFSQSHISRKRPIYENHTECCAVPYLFLPYWNVKTSLCIYKGALHHLTIWCQNLMEISPPLAIGEEHLHMTLPYSTQAYTIGEEHLHMTLPYSMQAYTSLAYTCHSYFHHGGQFLHEIYTDLFISYRGT
jgi:hypothetical protein